MTRLTGRSRSEDDVRILEAALGPLPPAVQRPALVLLSGLPGSGKSHLARELCSRYPIAHVESDALRKALFARPVYTPRESARLFAAIHSLIDNLLGRGGPVLLDATNLREAHRRPVYDIAEAHRARLLIVQVQVPDRVARDRLEARWRARGSATHSDADVGVYENMRLEEEPVRRSHLRVDGSENLSSAVDKIVKMLEAQE